MRASISIMLLLLALGCAFGVAYAQPTPQVGDFGTVVTSGKWDAVATWKQWDGSGWNTTPSAYPSDSTKSVFILAGDTITFDVSSKLVKTLVVESGAILRSDSASGAPRYLNVYGSIYNNGSLGGANMGISLNVCVSDTITGSGTTYLCRIRPYRPAVACTIDQDVIMVYKGTSGTGGVSVYFINGTGVFSSFTINAGKTLTLDDYSSFASNSATTSDAAVTTVVNIDGTLSMSGAHSTLALRSTSASGITLNIGAAGLVNVGGGFFPTNTGNTIATTVNNNGTLTLGSGSTGNVIDFGMPTFAISGTGSTTIGDNNIIRVGASAGLTATASAGNVQTTTRSYPATAAYSYVGATQATGDGLPTTVRSLTVADSGLTLSAATTVDSLVFTSGKLDATTHPVTVTTATSGGGASKYVLGTELFTATAGVASPYFVGLSSAYLPLTIMPATVTGSGQISVTAKNTVTDTVPSAPATTYLPTWYSLAVAGGLTAATADSVVLSFLPSEFAASGVAYDALGAAVYEGTAWKSIPVLRKDTVNGVLVVGPVSAVGNIVVGKFAPIAEFSKTSVAFGDQLVGIQKTDSLYVKNTGGDTLHLSATAPTDTTFIVTPLTASIAAGDSAKVYVKFKALSVGTLSNSLVFTSNAAKTSDTVSASGNGIVYTIKQARALATGSTVAFDGVVTRAMGSYVYMQDDSAGIVLYGGSGSIHDSIVTGYIKAGTKLRVAGTTSAYKNLLEIAIGATKYWTVIGTDTVPSPIPVTLTEISTNGEPYEARLVTVSNLSRADTVSTMWLPATSYYVTATGDTAVSIVVRIPNATDSKVDSTTMPKGKFNFTGVLGQFSSVATTGYQLMAVYLGDVADVLAPVVNVSPATLNFGKLLLATSATDSTLVKNTGNAVLTVKVGAPSDTTFKVTPDTLTIAAGDSAKLYVTFKPMAVDTFRTAVLLTCNTDAKYDSVMMGGKAYVMTIAEARRQPLLSHVAFTGAVTRAMGNYIYLQDDSAGIVIYAPTGSLADSLTAGSMTFARGLTIAGTTSEYGYLLEVAGSTVGAWHFAAVDTAGGWMEPIHLTLAQIAANGESYEARLVNVVGLTVSTTDTVWSAKKTYTIVDATDTTHAVALRLPNATDGSVDGTTVPSGTLMFTGVLGQYNYSDSTLGYQLMAINVGDIVKYTVVGVKEAAAKTIPTEYGLSQNYPNPFNPSTKIQFALPKSSPVSLKVYNMLGQEVATLSEGTMEAGTYTVTFDAHALASGMYFYRITADKYTAVRKMLLVK